METLEYIASVLMVVLPVLGLGVLLLAAPFYFITREDQSKKEQDKND